MIPTRATQPYRGGMGVPGPTLSAMLAGRPLFLPNPKDIERRARRRGSALAAALLAVPPK